MSEFIFLSQEHRLRAGWRFLLAALLYFFVTYLALELAWTLAPHQPNLFEFVFRGFSLLLLTFAYTTLAVLADKASNPLAYIGLAFRRRQIAEVIFGLALAAVLIGICVACIALAGSLILDIHLGPATIRLAAAQVLILAVAAMLEEMTFRGYPFQRLVEGLTAVPAIVILAVLFAAVHLRNPSASLVGAFNTVVIGVLLAIAYLRTQSLWLGWAIHFGWNATLGVIFGLPVSGLTQFAVVVRGMARGPAWLTGGDYGIEASLVATFVIALGILMLALIKPQAHALDQRKLLEDRMSIQA